MRKRDFLKLAASAFLMPRALARGICSTRFLLAGNPAITAIAQSGASAALNGTSPWTMWGLNQTPCPVPAAWNAQPVISCTSLAEIEAAVVSPGGAVAVMYDYENWPETPIEERLNPPLAQASQLVHGAGLRFFTAPGMDLVQARWPSAGVNADAYLALNLAGEGAQYAGMIDIQAQRYTGDPASYSSFVQQARAQALAANPEVQIMAGVTTCFDDGASFTADQIAAAVQSVLGLVDAIWLNIPGSSATSNWNPAAAIAALQGLLAAAPS